MTWEDVLKIGEEGKIATIKQLLLNQNNQQCIRSGYCCIKAPCILSSKSTTITKCSLERTQA